MSDTPVRRWPIRLAKASPLVAVLLLILLALSLPLPVPYSLLTLLYPTGIFGGHMMVPYDAAELYHAMRIAEDANLESIEGGDDPAMFVTAARETWHKVNVDPRELFEGDEIKTIPFGPGGETFDAIARWERANEATVWAWTVTAPEMPPVVASARGREGVSIQPQPVWVHSGDGENPFEPIEPDVVDDGKDAIAPWLWQELHTTDSTATALTAEMVSRQQGNGTGTDIDARLTGTIVANGVAWRCITVCNANYQDDLATWPSFGYELLEKDPREPGYDEWLEEYARTQEMDIWVFGPIESDAVPLRVPAGHDAEEADRLGAMVWPGLYLTTTAEVTRAVPVALDEAVSDLAGGPVGAMVLVDWTQQGNESYVPSGGVAAQAIAYLVVLDDMPASASAPLLQAWYGWQGLVGRAARPLFGLGYAFLLVSLVASPTALVIDRNRRVRARAAEERERMHRDAHDKVYNRLSALSKRVAEVGSAATNGTAGSLAAIAEDIRYTVGELQEILGDDVEHTTAALADASVADQLAAVCGAQAARLGVAVECDVASDVPALSPRLGWDLQCIAEEAITNAVRHGGATEVRVRLELRAPDTMVLAVTDNGSGTAVTSPDAAAEGSTGLKGMRDRAARHGGLLDIHGGEEGSTLAVAIPLMPERGGHAS